MATMSQSLHRAWWMTLISGIALLMFGVAAIAWPGITLLTLALLFALYLLVSGITNLIVGVMSIGRHNMWFLTMAIGALEVGIGVYALNNRLITAATLVLLVGFYLVIRGIVDFIQAFTANDGRSKGLGVFSGIIGFLAGIVVLRYPVVGGIAYVWVLGLYGLVGGAMLIALALESHHEVTETRHALDA